MKKICKISLILITFIILITNTVVFAGMPADYSNTPTIDTSEIEKIGGVILGAVNAVATIFAISVLLFLGIKFMLASPQAKAGVKAMATPYIIGAVLVFAATTIASIIYKVSQF